MAKRSRKETFEQLLKEDPMGTLFDKADAVPNSDAEEIRRLSALMYPAMERIKDQPGFSNEWHAINFNTKRGIARAAELLGVSQEDLGALMRLSGQHHKQVERAINLPTLKRSWKRLLYSSPVEEIAMENFPGETDRPFIVFYSADWCFPCQLTKPTFARLARFFDKAKLFYTKNDALCERENVKGVPQLVAYLPGGAKVHSYCGGTTQELWDRMNLLITLGQGFTGTGELVCTDAECRIEPKK